ncbi:MAG: hypothetical protein ACK44E_06055, partial [Anaerolineales bacterium]
MTTAVWRKWLRAGFSFPLSISEDFLKKLLIVLVLAWLLLGVILPLFPLVQRSLSDKEGNWVGFANYRHYFNTPALSISFINSLKVSIATTLLAVTLAFGYAYALSRTQMAAK